MPSRKTDYSIKIETRLSLDGHEQVQLFKRTFNKISSVVYLTYYDYAMGKMYRAPSMRILNFIMKRSGV